jgi:outer membrane protein TolC
MVPLLLTLALHANAQVSLYTVTDLALRNSPAVRMGVADVQKAAAGLGESKDAYIPNFILGSSLGYSYGFPVGQPSVYNVGSQSTLLSFSQPDYIRAARQALRSAEMALKDTREQVLQDAATDYVELNVDLQEIAAIEEQKSYADQLSSIELDRVQAGVDPRIAMLQAQLTAAQIELRRVHTEQDADRMRTRLANLTGLDADSFEPLSTSIPAMPDFASDGAGDRQRSAQNAGVAAADANAQSKIYLAIGDQRQNYRPLLSFGLQYNRYAKFNNYANYYLRFQHNNFDAGVEITIPLFDASRRAKALESSADAVHAKAEADQTRARVDENLRQLRRSLEELHAQQQVSALQAEIAQERLATVEQELKNGSGAPGASPITPQQADQAHIEERQRYLDKLDADLNLARAELGLLRLTGGMEAWLQAAPQK